MLNSFLVNLKNPPKKYRPIPFWSWNETLDIKETIWQIEKMDDAGIGGYFMHARGGLTTPYMGKKWMDNIQEGISEARKRKMGAWIYDENGWPSGFGDGRVSGKGEEYQQKYLRYEFVKQKQNNRYTITNITLEDKGVVHFYYEINPYYIDTLDGKVVKTFLKKIYEEYYYNFTVDFGRNMQGFFTDEPQVSRNGIPWSFVLTKKYQEEFQEDLLLVLPQLFFEIGDYKRTRYRFWYLIQELFVTNYSQQIYQWCEEHNVQLTGHMYAEEFFIHQITGNSAVMPHYEFFHMPGIDWLCRYIEPATTPLQVASVAHQLGKKYILSETFALCGWNVSMEELKWIYEWQMVRGVTHLCQHLQSYSLQGIRKRDYPPSLFYHQPYWDKYKVFNDLVSRIGMLLAEGEVDYKVLVLHPQSSAWLNFDNNKNNGIEELFNSFLEITKILENNQINFHYGDERIIRRHGQVINNNFIIGKQKYNIVIVPPSETFSKSTFSLIKQYVENGGEIIWIGEKPLLVEGVEIKNKNKEINYSKLFEKGISVEKPKEIINIISKDAVVLDNKGNSLKAITVTKRLYEKEFGFPCTLYYFVNSDLNNEYNALIKITAEDLCVLNMEDGTIKKIPYKKDGVNLLFQYKFLKADSLVILATDTVNSLAVEDDYEDLRKCKPLESSYFSGKWDIKLTEPNILTLDYCDYYFDDILQSKGAHISIIQEKALEKGKDVLIKMIFRFKVASNYEPEGIFLVLEKPKEYNIKVNGVKISNDDKGYYADKSFRKVNINNYIQKGLNQIILETNFSQRPDLYNSLTGANLFEGELNKLSYNSEIEAIYLIGNFGVQTPGEFTSLPRKALRYCGEFIIGPVPLKVEVNNLTNQGFPFNNSRLTIIKKIYLNKNEIKKRSLKIKEKTANIIGVKVNGKKVKDIYWQPYEIRLDDFLKVGENVFEIELIGSLRNMLGPHHLQEGESYTVSPACFFKEENIWGNQPWTDDYCFVEFGILI